MTPPEAAAEYEVTQKAAHEKYLAYWIEKFKNFGVNFVLPANGYLHKAITADGHYELSLSVYPRRFAGCAVSVWPASSPQTYSEPWIKIKSESGLRKLLKNLDARKWG